MSKNAPQIGAMVGSKKRSLLRVSNLSVSFGETKILRDVSFNIEAGEFIAIVGPNGAGKTTLLRTLLGAVPLAGGTISLAEVSADSYSTIERAGYLSYVPQHRDIPAGFSVREFVEMGLYAKGYRFKVTASVQESIRETLSQTGLVELSERYLETLSGGELQRVYLASALAQDAGIMLLDEPTTFLDPAHQRQMISILSKVRAQSKVASALIVTHDLNLAVSFADRILAFKEGSLVFDGTPSDFCDERRLQEIYDTTMRFIIDPITGKQLIAPSVLDSPSGFGQREQLR